MSEKPDGEGGGSEEGDGEPFRYQMEVSDQECPVCGRKALRVYGRVDEIPHFGRVLEQFIQCEACGYRISDVMCLEERDPAEYRYRVNSPDDVKVRVIRSPSGFLEIPELGVKVRPGPAAEGFVSNVEGVLRRIKAHVRMAAKWADREEARERAREILDRIEAALSGEDEITLVLKDPYGHSAIVPEDEEKLEVRRLEEDEVRRLRSLILRGSLQGRETF